MPNGKGIWANNFNHYYIGHVNGGLIPLANLDELQHSIVKISVQTKDISLSTPEVWNEDAAERDTHWIAVPTEFEQDIIQNAPYIEITYDKKDTDKIVGVKILSRPEPTPQPYQPNYNDKLLLASIS